MDNSGYYHGKFKDSGTERQTTLDEFDFVVPKVTHKLAPKLSEIKSERNLNF